MSKSGRVKGLFGGGAGKRIKLPNKRVKIALIATVAAILIAGIVCACVFIPPYLKQKQFEDDIKTNFVRRVFCYALDVDDETGIEIDKKWLGDYKLSDFEIKFDDDSVFALSNDGLLTLKDGAQTDDVATASIYSGETLASEICVNVVDADGYIENYEDLIAIEDGSTGVFIQTADIALDATHQATIRNFKGSYYGNAHVIANLNVKNGGLFDTCTSAIVCGLSLTSVSGQKTASEGESYGALINKAEYTNVSYCSVEGEFSVFSAANGANIGGMIGYASGSPRQINEDKNTDWLSDCTVAVELNVSVGGDANIGGAVGYGLNFGVANTKVAGKLNVDVADANNVDFLYVGGIFGVLNKTYEVQAYRITYLDGSYNLTSDIDVKLSVASGGSAAVSGAYVGGAFGMAANVRLNAIAVSGDIAVNGGGQDVFLGGIVAKAYNTFTSSVQMSVLNSNITGSLTANVTGRVYAGGLVAYARKITVSDTVATVEPTVNNAGNTVEKSDTVAHIEIE